MAGTGFEQSDFLTCCKFAEGDTRILMQKMARDRLRLHQKQPPVGPSAEWDEETKKCNELLMKLTEAEKCGDKQQAWDAHWVEVYELAEIIMARIMRDFA
jgi:acyl-CoA oxidase